MMQGALACAGGALLGRLSGTCPSRVPPPVHGVCTRSLARKQEATLAPLLPPPSRHLNADTVELVEAAPRARLRQARKELGLRAAGRGGRRRAGRVLPACVHQGTRSRTPGATAIASAPVILDPSRTGPLGPPPTMNLMSRFSEQLYTTQLTPSALPRSFTVSVLPVPDEASQVEGARSALLVSTCTRFTAQVSPSRAQTCARTARTPGSPGGPA